MTLERRFEGMTQAEQRDLATRAGLFDVREMRAGDVGYVVDSWVRETIATTRYANPSARKMGLDGTRRLARHVAATGRVVVACSPRDADTILGWAAGSKDGALWAVHVRWDMRHRGIGRALTTALEAT